MKPKILIAEDEADIIDLLRLYLEKDGYEVVAAANGDEAWNIMENTPIDLAVLDIMMPYLNGYELTKKIRSKYSIPIILLSAKQLDSDIILGLDLGADDYITKPFNPLQVVARIKSQLRRCYDLNRGIPREESHSSTLKVGELILDENTFTLKKNAAEVVLTPTEYRILILLMKSPGRVYTKSQIYDFVKGEYFESDDNTVMVHISKLRDKIEDNPRKPVYIKTIRGLGYKIEKESNLHKE